MSEVDRIWEEVDRNRRKVEEQLAIMNKHILSIEKTQREIIQKMEKQERNSVNRPPFISKGGSLSV